MTRIIILVLIEIFDICYNIFQKALKPMYPLFKEIFSLIYENIIKIIYFRVLKPFALYLYNKFIFYKERYKEYNKEDFKTRLISYKNEIIEYFRSHTSEEIINDIKFNFKLIYSCTLTVIKERWKYKDVPQFKIVSFYKDMSSRTISVKIIRNNIEITYYFTRTNNNVEINYNIFENLSLV